MATENIYICTVKESRHNNHKIMYSQKKKFSLNFGHEEHVYHVENLVKK